MSQPDYAEAHILDELPKISIRKTAAETDEAAKHRRLAEWLHHQASDTRERAEKLEGRSAKWGLLALATSYESRASHLESLIKTGSPATAADPAQDGLSAEAGQESSKAKVL